MWGDYAWITWTPLIIKCKLLSPPTPTHTHSTSTVVGFLNQPLVVVILVSVGSYLTRREGGREEKKVNLKEEEESISQVQPMETPKNKSSQVPPACSSSLLTTSCRWEPHITSMHHIINTSSHVLMTVSDSNPLCFLHTASCLHLAAVLSALIRRQREIAQGTGT